MSVVSPLTSASVETLLSTLLERFETLQMDQPKRMRVPLQAEIRSLDFWRSIVAECLASFFLIFIVCGSFIPWSGHTPPSIGIALAVGFAVAALTLTFAHISGIIDNFLDLKWFSRARLTRWNCMAPRCRGPLDSRAHLHIQVLIWIRWWRWRS